MTNRAKATVARNPTRPSATAISTLNVTPVAIPVTAIKPIATATSMSSASIRSGRVGPFKTRSTVSRKERQSNASEIWTQI